LLFDLKYDPTVIELPVPRYFKEEDRIDIDLAFKEKVKRDGDKAKKGKKKGKKKDDDEEPKEKKDTITVKENWIDTTADETFHTKEPV